MIHVFIQRVQDSTFHHVTDLLRLPVGPGALHGERFGFGDRPVLLLHGFGTSGFLWRDIAPSLPLGRVTAFAIDLFGYGESDRALDADFGIGAQADYIDRAMTVLRVARADIVGVDVGAAVALALAARRPARIRSLVLVNPGDPAALRSPVPSPIRSFISSASVAARWLRAAPAASASWTLLAGPTTAPSPPVRANPP